MVVNIEDLKNDIVGQLGDALTEDAKKALLIYIRDHILPIAKDIGQKYIDQLKDDALSESGWTKFRDAIFLPVLIDGSLWSINAVIDKLIERA